MRTRTYAAVCAAICVLGSRSHGAPRPGVVRTIFGTPDVVIASVTAHAPRDGRTDAGEAIQRAIDAAAAAGGGVVFVPGGRYRLETALVLREGVTLRGDWTPPRPRVDPRCTILMPTAGRGETDGPPAITMERGTGISGITFWYPEQRPEGIVPYPWTIASSERVVPDNFTVQNATFVNAYQAMRFGPAANELHTVRHVYGTPLKTGVWVDSCTDIGRLNRLRFSPAWWEGSGLPGAPATRAARRALRAHLVREAVGVDLLRSDWEYVYDVSVGAYAVGVRFRAGAQGTSNAVMFGCSLRACRTALEIDQLNPIGLSAVGCTLDGVGHAVLGAPALRSVVQLNACRLSASAGSALALQGPATVTMQNCSFRRWRGAAVEAERGSVVAMGCDFGQRGAHVLLAPAVARARLLGNRFAGAPGIRNESRGDVMVSHRPMQLARPDVRPHVQSPDRRPARGLLFLVTGFGASPRAADNTAAFQRALSRAGQAGGGTVYVPAGNYRFAGSLRVPKGVELRGVFDVPHHTQSGGSVLMPTAGRGQEKGTPFVQLASGSGLRGLTFWYPEQSLRTVVAYPWAVRSLGPRCWLVDVTFGNAYQGADFGTYPSDGHVIRYMAGAMLRRGLWVSKCRGDGWVEDVMMNPHYSVRLNAPLPKPPDYEGDVIAYQRAHLDGIVFGRCEREHVRGTFLYAAYDGLAFRGDGGGGNARVILHGTDTASRPMVFEATGSRGVEIVNLQITPLSDQEVAGIVSTPSFRGRARIFCTQIWAGHRAALLEGPGEVLLQQVNDLSGPMTVRAGQFGLESGIFAADWQPQVRVEEGCRAARILACLAPDQLRIENHAGARLTARAGSLSPPPVEGPATHRTGWEPGDPASPPDTVQDDGGGLRGVADAACRPAPGEGRDGGTALRISGEARNAEHSCVYFRIGSGPVAVNTDTTLAYWFRPTNALSRHIGIDALFADGSTLRDAGAADASGTPVHPGTERGRVGEWTRIVVPIGRACRGRSIRWLMLAYDGRPGEGRFEAYVDDLAITSPEAGTPWSVEASPPGGRYARGVTVHLSAPGAAAVRYTLDGSTPTPSSPRYLSPIRLGRPGLWEVRYAAQGADGRVSGRAGAQLYDVGPWPR